MNRERLLNRTGLVFICLLLAFAFQVRAGRYRVVACGDYPGSDSDLATYDADYFDDEMSYYGNSCERFYSDSSVSYYSFKPSSRIDYFYYAGHGDYGELCPSDGYDSWTVTDSTFGETGNVRHFIFASCYSVDSKYSWSYCFGSGVKTVLGYRESISNGECWHIARNYPSAIAYKSVTDGSGHIREWFDENDYSYSTDYKAAAVGYDSQGYLSFWTWLDVDRKASAEMVMDLGRIRVCTGKKALENLSARSMPRLIAVSNDHSALPISRDLCLESTGLNRLQAAEIAAEAVYTPGLIENNFRSRSAHELVRESCSGDSRNTVCYSFTWEREHNGIPVCGYNGDIIRVKVSGRGEIIENTAVIREINEKAGRSTVMDAVQALKKSSTDICSEVRGRDNINITGIDLVYFSPEKTEPGKEYIPSYRLEINGSWYLFIDAKKGSLIR